MPAEQQYLDVDDNKISNVTKEKKMKEIFLGTISSVNTSARMLVSMADMFKATIANVHHSNPFLNFPLKYPCNC